METKTLVSWVKTFFISIMYQSLFIQEYNNLVDKQGSDIHNQEFDRVDYDVEKNWYEVRLAGKVPERRGYHSTFLKDQKLYIFGGHDIREGSLDNLWMLDLENFNDLDMQPEDQERSCHW